MVYMNIDGALDTTVESHPGLYVAHKHNLTVPIYANVVIMFVENYVVARSCYDFFYGLTQN